MLQLSGREVELREVPGGERHDSAGLDRLLSCGTALANVTLAVRAHGWDVTVEVDGGHREPDLAARVRVVRPQRPSKRELLLYRSISAPDVVDVGHGGMTELRQLMAAVDVKTARLEPVGGTAFASILLDVSRRLDGDRRCTAELLPWLAELSMVPRPHCAEPVTRQQSAPRAGR